MQAIILAAGMGKRLKELTRDNTKCMVKVNGVSLIDRMLHQIQRQSVNRIIIVIGYKGEKLKEYIETLGIETPVTYIDNPIYDKTNNIYSLSLASEYLCEDDTLLFESDLIFEDSALDALVSDPRGTLALVDKYESWMSGTCIKIDDKDRITEFVPGNRLRFEETGEYYKTVNIYKFSREFSNKYYVPFLDAYQKALGENEYYEEVLRVITMLDEPVIRAKRLDGQKWYEIDDIQDLDIATTLFTTNQDEHVELLKKRYGGYWRYPKLLDFCYLVNPYFPPQRMIDEIKANFDVLLRDYPSGMYVNSLLASRNFGVHQENILVGNGASELIKSLMGLLDGRLGVIRPSFEEYSHRYDEGLITEYWPENDDYSYTADDLIRFFTEHRVDNLILINPDNPSGNYLPHADVEKLIGWTAYNQMNLVLDESFADFVDEADNTFIRQDILDKYQNLLVMKSISKSYGVPGLRLGVLASGNTDMIEQMKKDVAIWNINSFAEFYMQIAEKYSGDYENAMKKARNERNRFENELADIHGLRVIPSQANYVMAEIMDGITAAELNRIMISRYEILIKDLSAKLSGDRQYMRLAVRTREENNRLISALKDIL